MRIHSNELGCDIHVGHGVECAPDQILWWAVRPEKLLISREEPAAPHKANRVKGIVEEIAYLGDMSVFQVRLETGKTLRVTRTNRAREEQDSITWDESVWVSWGDTAGSVLVS